jgi:hypothetical protein
MGCRIFRELKLGLFADVMTDQDLSKIVGRDMGAIQQLQSRHVFELRTQPGDAGVDTDMTCI